MLAQFNRAACKAFHSKDSISPHVPHLKTLSCPNHVFRKITNIVINAVNRPALFARSHKGKKWLESIPLGAQCYSALSIIFKLVAVRICASLLHRRPNFIDSGFFTMRCLSMLGSLFVIPTATRFGMATRQIPVIGNEFCSARTSHPTAIDITPRMIDAESGGSKHESPSKCEADDVSFGRHNGASFTVLFSGGRPATTGAHCDCRINSANVN